MKKILVLLITIVAAVTVGCNNNAVAVSEPVSEPEPQAQVVVEEPPVEVEPASEVVVEPVSEVVVEPEEGDPALKALEVDEVFAKENGLLCLYRKGKLYGLGPYLPAQTTYDQHIGHVVTSSLSELSNWKVGEGLVFGPAPEVILEDGDELRDYSGYHNSFTLCRFDGYTVSVWSIGPTYILPYLDDKAIYTEAEVTVRDADGNVVEDRTNLVRNAVYAVEWYEGVQYCHYDLWAYNAHYTVSGDRYDASETLTKEGYGLIDWKSMEPGIYSDVLSTNLPITIK